MVQNDKAVIQAFVAYRASHDLSDLQVDGWPDVDNPSDIDALAGPLAIEHTSVDMVADQRRDGVWFSNVVEPIEHGPARQLPFRLEIIFPYEGVARGQDWQSMRRALETWVLNSAASLPDGRQSVSVPDVPFAFDVIKSADRTPGVFFMRYSPAHASLADRLRQHVERKAAKLVPYRAQGKRGVLLLESNDIALMNRSKLLDALRAAFPDALPDGIDEIWYADTSVPGAAHDFHDCTRVPGH